MVRSVALSRLLPGAFAVAALAAPAAHAAPAQSIAGEYVELQAGWGHVAIPGTAGTAATSPVVNTGSSRPIFGFGAGYDLNVLGEGNPLIAGLGANMNFARKTACKAGAGVAGDSLCGKFKYDLDIGARIGYQLGDTVVYGRVAYDITRVRTDYLKTATSTVVTKSTTAQGVRLAAGLEQRVFGKVYVKGEYRFTPKQDLASHQQVVGSVGLRF